MRASTLFALTAAVLIGLGVAVTAKMGGYFAKPPVDEKAKKIDTQVLVASRNIFAGDTINGSDVRLRVLKESEVEAYNKNKDKDYYLPPVPAAAYLRIAKRNIEADAPITKDMLEKMEKPVPLNERLQPDHRALNIALTKDRSAGGLVQVGEWVEVYLTSWIEGGDGGRTSKTAALIPHCRVIAKRDSLWPVFAPLPKDKPIEYTLEVNSYRAELFEFARSKGIISIAPLPPDEQKKYEAERKLKMASRKEGEPAPANISEEAEEEFHLAQQVDRGEIVVGDQDLIKLFDLRMENPIPPRPATVAVERFVGTHRAGVAEFTIDGKPYFDNAGGVGGYGGYSGGVYPKPPYSPVINWNTGRALNLNYGGIQGMDRHNYSNAASSTTTWRFGAPSKSECPTCGKNKQ